MVYRPNEAKVRNLKTKDYLGKARLVAASDRANAFTGFAGSEIKNAGKSEIKDDRPADNISFAATNLVKPGIQSRAREGAGQPMPGGQFPPTPPPESDRPRELPARAASVRNGPKPMPPKLNIDRAVTNQDRYQKAMSPEDARPRGPPRSNTNASSRSYSRQNTRRSPIDEDAYPEDVYDMYSAGPRSTRGPGSQSGRRPQQQQQQQQRYDDYDEDDGSDYDGNSVDEGDFEMMNPRRGTGSVSGSSRGQSRRPEVRKVRVKVHADDVRYIMVGTAVEFPDMVDRIRDKFGIRRRFKIKVRDEDSPSDMITMGDQDDLEMVMMGVKSQARKNKLEVGKLEVSQKLHVLNRADELMLTMITDLGPGDCLIARTRWMVDNIPPAEDVFARCNDGFLSLLKTKFSFGFYMNFPIRTRTGSDSTKSASIADSHSRIRIIGEMEKWSFEAIIGLVP